jgi:long-chain fatty acid transport protein
MFYVMDLNPRMRFGIGISVPFGLKTEYDSNWIGRFQGISAEIRTLNINPSLSYKLSESFSIGGGISYQHGKVDLLTGVNYSGQVAGTPLAGFVPPNSEGQNKTSVDGDAWGFNVGTLFNITPVTRMGIAYRSSLKYKLDGNTSFSNVPAAFALSPAATAQTANGNVKLDLKTPDSLAFSVAHRLDDRWELLGDFTWWHWSKIKQLPVVRDTGATLSTLSFNFDDTWRASIGANYKLNGPWTLKLGAAYDQTPVPNAESRSVRLPDNDRYWLSAGAAYQVSRNGRLDFGYSLVSVKNADINNDQRATGAGLVNGSYKARIHVLGVQYQHTF